MIFSDFFLRQNVLTQINPDYRKQTSNIANKLKISQTKPYKTKKKLSTGADSFFSSFFKYDFFRYVRSIKELS